MIDHEALARQCEEAGADRQRELLDEDKIDALVAKGWDWHSAYRHVKIVTHARNTAAILRSQGGKDAD